MRRSRVVLIYLCLSSAAVLANQSVSSRSNSDKAGALSQFSAANAITEEDIFWNIEFGFGAQRLHPSAKDLLDSFNVIYKEPAYIIFDADEGYFTATINNIKGNNTLVYLKSDIGAQQSDVLHIHQHAFGHFILAIDNNGASPTTGQETLTVVEVGENHATWVLQNNVEAGAYEYQLRPQAENPNCFELYSTPEQSTTTAEASTSFLNIGYLTNYIENQTLLQRLGEFRDSWATADTATGNLWVKGFGGKLNSFTHAAFAGFTMNYLGAQVGGYRRFMLSDGQLLIGTMVGYTDTYPNYRRGSGSGKNYTVGAYTTYSFASGFYIDAILKYNHMQNYFSVQDTANNRVNGTSTTQGISASIELGQRFWFHRDRRGWYVEPQSQLAYGYQTGDNIQASNGLAINLHGYHSVLARASALLGYQLAGVAPVKIYLKTGIVREMRANTSYQFNHSPNQRYSFRANWLDNGLGITMTFNQHHKIYAEADYAVGTHFDNSALHLGYRYSF